MEIITAKQAKDIFNNVFVSKLGIEITPETLNLPMTTGIGMDSLDIVEVTMELESKYGINVPDAESSQVVNGTVKTLLSVFVKKLVAANRLSNEQANMLLTDSFWKSSTEKPTETRKPEPQKTNVQPAPKQTQMVQIPKALLDEYTATLNRANMLAEKIKQYVK